MQGSRTLVLAIGVLMAAAATTTSCSSGKSGGGTLGGGFGGSSASGGFGGSAASGGVAGGAGGSAASGGVGGGSVVTCRNYASPNPPAALWEQLVPSGSAPQPRYGASKAYDAAHDALILFGGTDKTSSYNDVRVLANASGASGAPAWTNQQVAGALPSARSFALAAYNSAQDALFIFGGVDGNNRIQTDLWKLANASAAGGTPTWSSMTTAGTSPAPARVQMSGIYDEKSDTLVFFGGLSCNGSLCTLFNDTYALQAVSTAPTWARVDATGGAPPARFYHSSIYDPVHDAMVIFGGNASTNFSGDATANLDDTWALPSATAGGGAWREVVPASAVRPAATEGHSAVYDQNNDRMVVYGGVNTRNYVTTATWILAGVASQSPRWFAYDTGATTPPSRTLHAAAYAGGAVNRMIVFGGSTGSNTYASDTWALHNANGLPTSQIARIAITSASTTVCAANWVQLTATAYDANDQEISSVFVWSSSDSSIAAVDVYGRVIAIAEGTVTITVTDETGTVTATTVIKVTPPAASGAGGSAGGAGAAGGSGSQYCYSTSYCIPSVLSDTCDCAGSEKTLECPTGTPPCVDAGSACGNGTGCCVDHTCINGKCEYQCGRCAGKGCQSVAP